MFVQVIKGKAKDAKGLRAQADEWVANVRPGAIGYLGSTFGIADDGTFVIFARFENEDAAKHNSARPEQGAWWEATTKFIDGEPTFRESSDVSTLFEGGSDAAGFVQVMEGRVHDRVKADAMETPALLAQLRAARPDLLGATRVWFDGGTFAEAAYFTSEADARKGESSTEFAGPQEEYAALFSEMTFIDLRDPQLSSPAA
jgi:quinol monooxygenase YgiN